MAVNFNDFSEGSNINGSDYLVGFFNTNVGGERKWTAQTLASYIAPNSNIWNDTTTTVAGNSALWISNPDSGVRSITGNWQSTYNTVNSLSSSWPRKYATNIGNGSLKIFTVTHNLGTRDVITSVYDNSTYENIITSVANTTTNTVSLSFSTAPGSNAYRVVVIG